MLFSRLTFVVEHFTLACTMFKWDHLCRVRKKYPEHYRLSLETGISNFNNFWYDDFWHN